MTHEELCEKYAKAADEIRELVAADVSWDWDLYSHDEVYYTVFVHTAQDHEDGTNRQIYDRQDSPIDRDLYGTTTTQTWVILPPPDSTEAELTAPTLAEAIRLGIERGWLPGR